MNFKPHPVHYNEYHPISFLTVELDKVGDEVDWKSITELDRNVVHRRLDELEARSSKAKIAARGGSHLPFNFVLDELSCLLLKFPLTLVPANGQLRGGKSLDDLRQRILFCERRINRNYLRPSFCLG